MINIRVRVKVKVSKYQGVCVTGVVRVKVGVIVIAIITVVWLDLTCILQLFYVCIQLCWKRNRKASRLR